MVSWAYAVDQSEDMTNDEVAGDCMRLLPWTISPDFLSQGGFFSLAGPKGSPACLSAWQEARLEAIRFGVFALHSQKSV